MAKRVAPFVRGQITTFTGPDDTGQSVTVLRVCDKKLWSRWNDPEYDVRFPNGNVRQVCHSDLKVLASQARAVELSGPGAVISSATPAEPSAEASASVVSDKIPPPDKGKQEEGDASSDSPSWGNGPFRVVSYDTPARHGTESRRD